MALTTQNTTTAAATPDMPNAGATLATRYVLDASHSHVGFAVRHLMISNVRGEFGKVSGEATYDAARPEASTLRASVEVASINTKDEKRDAHLRSADFFDAEKFPTIDFVATSVKKHGDGLDVIGDLTIHGTTRSIALTVEELTPEHSDPWGNLRIGATARTKIKRSEFGMSWNAALEAGGVLVGDEIKIEIEAELIKQK